MKRLFTLLLALVLMLAATTALSSCDFLHECSFATDWSHDDTDHWHVCVGENLIGEKLLGEKCAEVSEKAAHTWNEGEITTEATQEADGVKTYTCTVCSHTKTETVPFIGMTRAEWGAVIHPNRFANFTMDMEMVVSASDLGINMQITATMLMKFTENAVYMYAEAAGESMEEVFEGSTADEVADILAVCDYDNFTYDRETKLYHANRSISIPWDEDADPTDTTLRFEDGRLVEMKYSYTFMDDGVETQVETTVSFVDYGTTVILVR